MRHHVWASIGCAVLVSSLAACGSTPAVAPSSAANDELDAAQPSEGQAASGAVSPGQTADRGAGGSSEAGSRGSTPGTEAAASADWVPMATSAQTVGGLSQEQVVRLATKKLPGLGQACHSKVSKRTELDVGLSVEPAGTVSNVEVVGALDDKTLPLASCIKGQTKTWALPKSKRASNVLLRIAWVKPAEAKAQQELQQAITRQGREAAKRCHQHLDAGQAETRLFARLLLGADGRVQRVQLATRNKPLAQCLEKAMKSWTFPAATEPRGIAVPLVLKAKP